MAPEPPQSDSTRLLAERLANKVVALYDACEQENENLQKQVDVCAEYQSQCEASVHQCNSLVAEKNRLIAQGDSIIWLQHLQIGNFNKEVKDDKKISVRRIAGFTVGGFLLGVTLPLLVLLLRH